MTKTWDNITSRDLLIKADPNFTFYLNNIMVDQKPMEKGAMGLLTNNGIRVAIRNSMTIAKDHALALASVSWDGDLGQKKMLGMV